MKIRKATVDDREAWNYFVDSQDGNLRHYFDWKYVVEKGGDTYVPLLVETGPSQIIGIFPIIKKEMKLYSLLTSWTGSGGPLLKKNLSKEDAHLATTMLLQYVDSNYSDHCSSSKLMEMIQPDMDLAENPKQAVIDNGYRLRYYKNTNVPCDFILELKPPFEKNIWMGLWSQKFRQALRKVEKNGIIVIEDEEMRYADTYVDMLASNYRRHREPFPPKEQIIAELKVFRENTKLFVALKGNTAIVILCCHYSPSTCYLWQVGSFTKDTDDINKYLYKVAIEKACDGGYRFVDFGTTSEHGLARLKTRFRGARIPMRIYEKRYSVPRTCVELITLFTRNVRHKKNYIWYHRYQIWDSVIHW